MDSFDKLTTPSGVDLAYTDNGAPSRTPYVTIIAIHGMCFSAPVFKRAQDAASKKGVRFVALNRRGYPGSTPFTPEEKRVVNHGTTEAKNEFFRNRGHESAWFIDMFIRKNDIPPITDDGKSGGVVLLGWSMGGGDAVATIAYIGTLPPDTRSRLSSHMRSLILYDTNSRVLGLSVDYKEWRPFQNDSIPMELRQQAVMEWVTAYFDHGDISARDPEALSHFLPSTSRPGTIYNMSKAEQEEIIYLENFVFENAYKNYLTDQRFDGYSTAFYDPTIVHLLPNMKVSYIVGNRSPSNMLRALWDVQKDADERKNASINFRVIPANHFIHWDEPDVAVDAFLECAGVLHSVNGL